MNDEQIDRAERLLSYYEAHGSSRAVFPRAETATGGEWWIGEAVALLRSALPEWSTYRESVDTDNA